MQDQKDPDTTSPINADRVKEQMAMMHQASRILMIVLAVVGLGLVMSNAEAIGRLAAFNLGLVCLVWAGHMVIAAGALRGHLALLRVMMALYEEIKGGLDELKRMEWQNGKALNGIAKAAGDELGPRRGGQ